MSALARQARPHMTVGEYLALPETSTRMEYVEGEVIVSPSPTISHQQLQGRLYEALRAWARTRPKPRPTVLLAPLDIRFAQRRILQPDLTVWVGGLRDQTALPVRQIPDLCIEVLSEDQDYDRVAKRLMYGEAGVRELWAIDPGGAVERWTGDRLGDWEAVEGTLRTPLLPGYALDVAALFDALDED